MTAFSDFRLKERRHAKPRQSPGFHATEAMLEDRASLEATVAAFAPDVSVQLAALGGRPLLDQDPARLCGRKI